MVGAVMGGKKKSMALKKKKKEGNIPSLCFVWFEALLT